MSRNFLRTLWSEGHPNAVLLYFPQLTHVTCERVRGRGSYPNFTVLKWRTGIHMSCENMQRLSSEYCCIIENKMGRKFSLASGFVETNYESVELGKWNLVSRLNTNMPTYRVWNGVRKSPITNMEAARNLRLYLTIITYVESVHQ
jgi:hypothetical protein